MSVARKCPWGCTPHVHQRLDGRVEVHCRHTPEKMSLEEWNIRDGDRELVELVVQSESMATDGMLLSHGIPTGDLLAAVAMVKDKFYLKDAS